MPCSTVLQRTGFDSAGRAGSAGGRSDRHARRHFVDHPVAGRLRGKTGTLNNPPFNVDPPAVKALAGFLPVEGGSAVEYVLDPQRSDDLGPERVSPGVGCACRRARHLSSGRVAGGRRVRDEPAIDRLDGRRTAAPGGVPLRYRRAPLLGLLLMALVPLAALDGAARVERCAGGRARGRRASGADRAGGSGGGRRTESALDDRDRRPPAGSRQHSHGSAPTTELAAAMEELAVFIDERSCLAVSVDGRPVRSWNGDLARHPCEHEQAVDRWCGHRDLGADHRFATSVAAPPTDRRRRRRQHLPRRWRRPVLVDRRRPARRRCPRRVGDDVARCARGHCGRGGDHDGSWLGRR